MSISKPFKGTKFVLDCLCVFAVFMIIDYLYYGLIAPVNPYAQDLLHKIIWTLVLAIPFTYVFYRFNSNWWVCSPTLPACKTVAAGVPCGNNPGSKALAYGFYFGVVMGVAFIAVIALSCYVVMYSFIHLLDGFRGIPESGVDDGILILKSGIAGAALACTGKEESDVDRLRPPGGSG